MARQSPLISKTLSSGEVFPVGTGLATYLRCLTADGRVRVDLLKQGEVRSSHIMVQGDAITRRDFDSIVFTEILAGSNAILFDFGDGEFYPSQNRSTVVIDDSTPVEMNLAGGSVTLNQSNISNGASDLADLALVADTPAQAIVGSADNVLVTLTNPIDSGYPVRVACHANVDGSTGTVLQPGDTWEKFTQADVYAMAVGGAVNLQRELDTRT